MAESQSNRGASPKPRDPTAGPSVGADGAIVEEPSLALRPGVKLRQDSLLRDLDRPGWVAISHLGQVTWKPRGSTEVSSGALESALAEEPKANEQ
jgi:hypothetical protein